MSFLPQDAAVQQQSMSVCTLALPLTITASATSTSVVVTVENPSLLFIKTQGTNRITLAAGAVDSAAELSAITFASATDSTGVFNALIRLNQQVKRVVNATVYSRTVAATLVNATLTSAPATGITSVGDKVVLNVDLPTDLTSTDFDGVIVLNYEPLN